MKATHLEVSRRAKNGHIIRETACGMAGRYLTSKTIVGVDCKRCLRTQGLHYRSDRAQRLYEDAHLRDALVTSLMPIVPL